MQRLASALLLLAAGSASGTGLSPVTRVVELLQGLQEKVEFEHKREQELFTKYQCWAKTVIGAKTKSNEKAQSRKDELTAYVADLDAGRIELTSERVDLEKEIAGLTEDIETAEAMRAKEHEDYLAAKDELEKAKAALEEAISVLEEATGGASFLSLEGRRGGEGAEASAAQGEALANAIEVGERFLSKGDSVFLRRLLTGDVPDAPTKDWEKLNKKADFKMKYEARSGKIQKTLKSLLFTFSAGLDDVEKKEAKAVETHGKLMTSKREQLTGAQDAYSKMELEGAARGLSKSEAQAEIQALTTQIEDDKRYIGEVEQALSTKTTEWDARKTVREKELAAISQAISILHGDDARDLFKRSLSSQGYLLLQERAETRAAARQRATRRDATAVLREAARKAGDRRLVALASRIAKATPAHFAAVVGAIDTIIAQLQEEETKDLEIKENCEKTRAEDTRKAATLSRAMDELSDTITRLEQEIAEIEAEIQGKEEEIEDIQKELEEAREIRTAEHAEWLKTDKDDEDAAKLVDDATKVLEAFYEEHKFLQEPPEVMAGEAPPPPPSTWEAPYKGKQEENQGIVAILTLIKEDIERDRATAKTAEDNAAQAFTTLETESTTQIGTLQGEVTTLEGTKSSKEGEVETAKEDRLGKKSELEAVMKKLKDAAPGCNFFTVHYAMRASNRQIELDGLNRAKAILSAAAPVDANATAPELLQQVRRHA